MKTTVKAFLATSALACMAVVGTAGAADAAGGRLTLISGTGAATITYSTCQTPRPYPVQQPVIDAFINEPLPGCQAVLVNTSGTRKVLCVGRGSVPVEFRRSARVIIQPGTAPACTFEATASN
ncbi:hypothetical protein [Nonomuraea aurantiaca]|jgi:hypothetical protein|uniref:hypothetical protein n=1 Tax=Nonomuraea aurantiaca TaxID=2878562 RepID=UPI001CDA1BCB|nr:hypothetical protein [Nonomuraea aurantiaca]MCA2220814.1 hypothetical protein [Nonomuraea aurantiaca]